MSNGSSVDKPFSSAWKMVSCGRGYQNGIGVGGSTIEEKTCGNFGETCKLAWHKLGGVGMRGDSNRRFISEQDWLFESDYLR
jgi:hypothetical protein